MSQKGLLNIVGFTILMIFMNGVHSYKHRYKSPHYHPQKRGQQSNIKSSLLNVVSPQQIHISYGKRPTDMVILWATGTKEPKMAVHYSFNTKISDMSSVVGEQKELSIESDKGAKFWHRAYLPNLKPGTTYYYYISSKKTGVKSDMFKFKVPFGKPTGVQSYMVLANMGIKTKSLKYLVQEVKNKEYNGVFHIGDIGQDLHDDKGMTGDKFLHMIQPMTAEFPYFVSPGDHDTDYDYSHYRYRFSMPGNNWPMKSDKLFYSVNIGMVHFVSINTEQFFTLPQKNVSMLNWLAKDLENKPKSKPWTIVLGHRPLYSSCDKKSQCVQSNKLLKQQLEDLLFKYGVDIYISGHRHNYERTWPVYKNKIVSKHYKNPKAPIYINIGTLGSAYGSDKSSSIGGIWSAKLLSDGKESFGVLDVINATHVHWRVLGAINNEKIDLVWIIKQQNQPTYRDPTKYLEKKKPTIELPPEPLLLVDPNTRERVSFRSLHRRPSVLFKESGLIVALITGCSIVFLICVFSKKLWKRF